MSVLFGCCCEILICLQQKTAYELSISDWCSDVCSSDLMAARVTACHPTADISAPELSEASVTIPITRKSFSPCTRACSEGRCAPASIVVEHGRATCRE